MPEGGENGGNFGKIQGLTGVRLREGNEITCGRMGPSAAESWGAAHSPSPGPSAEKTILCRNENHLRLHRPLHTTAAIALYGTAKTCKLALHTHALQNPASRRRSGRQEDPGDVSAEWKSAVVWLPPGEPEGSIKQGIRRQKKTFTLFMTPFHTGCVFPSAHSD